MKYYVLSGTTCKTFYAINSSEGICQSIEMWRRGDTLDCIFIFEFTSLAGTYDAIASKAIQDGYPTIQQKEWNAVKKEATDFIKKMGTTL